MYHRLFIHSFIEGLFDCFPLLALCIKPYIWRTAFILFVHFYLETNTMKSLRSDYIQISLGFCLFLCLNDEGQGKGTRKQWEEKPWVASQNITLTQEETEAQGFGELAQEHAGESRGPGVPYWLGSWICLITKQTQGEGTVFSPGSFTCCREAQKEESEDMFWGLGVMGSP